jgi:AWS domain
MDHERRRRKKRPAVWQLVRENIYTHRQRKEQDEDDIMICQCRRPTDGGVGCGPDCLNRLLNIECVPVSAATWCLQTALLVVCGGRNICQAGSDNA